MAITDEEKQQLKKEILEEIKSSSQGVTELDKVTNLAGVNSLPAMQGTKVVLVPMPLLSKPAEDAAAVALTAADMAEDAAAEAGAIAETTRELAKETAATIAESKSATAAAEGVVAEFNAIAEQALGGVSLFNVNQQCGDNTYTLTTALASVKAKEVNDNVPYRKKGLVITYRVDAAKWETKQFIGASLDEWANEELWKSFGGGSGSGAGNVYNVTVLQPLEVGYYTLAAAIAAVEREKAQALGLVVTFAVSDSRWESYQFIGTDTAADYWNSLSLWKVYGGDGSVKSVAVNGGERLSPDAEGNVNLTIPIVEVDEALDENSTNPVENRAVQAALKGLDGQFGADIQVDEETKILSLLDKSGNVLGTAQLPAGGGGGSEATTALVLSILGDTTITVKAGSTVKIGYAFSHVNAEDQTSTGETATAVCKIVRGAVTQTITEQVAQGTHYLDLTKYLGTGTNNITIRLVTNTSGQVKQVGMTVRVVALTIASSYGLATFTRQGDAIAFPYSVSGSGAKTVYFYLDGVQVDSTSVTASSTSRTYNLSTTKLTHGRHSFQVKAVMELDGGDTIESSTLYYDLIIYAEGNTRPIVGCQFEFSDGSIIAAGKNVTLPNTTQYQSVTVPYVVYVNGTSKTDVELSRNGKKVSTVSADRTLQRWNVRMTDTGALSLKLKAGITEYPIGIQVDPSDIDITDTTANLELKLTASGRSNTESDPATWEYGDVRTEFRGFNFDGNGWMTGADGSTSLHISDGAAIDIGLQPFVRDFSTGGKTLEFEFKTSNVKDFNATVISCYDEVSGIGLRITAQEAKIIASAGSSVSTKFKADERVRVGFVIKGKGDGEKRMMYLYIDGIKSGAVQYAGTESFAQAVARNISAGAASADVDLYNIRCYARGLSDTEMLNNRMVDMDDVDGMISAYERNDILDADSSDESIDTEKLADQLPIMIFTGDIEGLVNANNKKNKYPIDISYIDKRNPDKSFEAVQAVIQLQGTSSLAYPRKNFKFKLKSDYAGNSFAIAGEDVPGKKYQLRDDSFPVNCFCLKADFAESSGTHNTGMARIVHRALQAAGIYTPAQRGYTGEYDVRTTVDGFPIACFYRPASDSPLVFMGKYNFNNDKSTENVFGFEGIAGVNAELKNREVYEGSLDELGQDAEADKDAIYLITKTGDANNNKLLRWDGAAWVETPFDETINPCECWEFLNNSDRMCLFKESDFETLTDGEYRWLSAFEGRYPDTCQDPRNLKVLCEWLVSTDQEQVRTGGKITIGGEEVADTKANRLAKFKAECAEHFNLDFLLSYYLLTDIFAAVDQRAKNMMFASWGKEGGASYKWYPIFYDNDTILGVRNDGKLAYGYDLNDDSRDEELQSYAYAGHDSVLWQNLKAAFASELAVMYRRLRTGNALTYASCIGVFNDEQSAAWCEAVKNKDAMYKYITPLLEGVMVNNVPTIYDYLYSLQGSRDHHRKWFLYNRINLLDSKYQGGDYTGNNVNFRSNNPNDVSRQSITLTAFQRLYFAVKFGEELSESVMLSPDDNASHTFSHRVEHFLDTTIYGASYLSTLDISDMYPSNPVSLTAAVKLQDLLVGKDKTGYRNTGISSLTLTGLTLLRRLNVCNIENENFTALDLTTNVKMEECYAQGSSLQTVSFAPGAPLRILHLPASTQSLEFKGLPNLTDQHLQIDGYANINRVQIENTPGVDSLALLERIFAAGESLQYVRITDIDREGDGRLLVKLLAVGGIDEHGATQEKAVVTGRYRLTQYLADELYQQLTVCFEDLEIIQPEWTCLEFDDSILDAKNISNLDNRTGYRFDNAFTPSAHISAILAQRHRSLGKKTAEDVVTIFPLHDENSNFYADASDLSLATPAVLTGREGFVWMYEPHYWYKGVNDFLNQKKYSFFSSNASCPATDGEYVKLQKEELEVIEGVAVRIGEEYATLAEAQTSVSADSCCIVPLPAGYRQARFPSLSSAAYGAVWLDDAGTILGRLRATSSAGLLNGMYLFSTIPSGATRLAFTISNAADFDYVLLTTSDKIEAVEPDWCEHDECLCSVYEAFLEDDFLKSISDVVSTGSVSQGDLSVYAKNSGKGFQLIDWDMHKDVANLFYAKYGTRDSQGQCGYGESSYSKKSGLTNMLGMRDTINPDGKTTGAYYYEGDTLKDAKSTNVMGYECWQGDKCEWLDGVTLNKEKANGRWSIETPGRPARVVQGIATFAEYWPANMVHGRHMDLIVARGGGSETSGYHDWQNVSGGIARVVYRSSNNAGAYGGVSYASTYSDSSSTNAYIGSRLAFRGKIVKATSVSEYKASVGVE